MEVTLQANKRLIIVPTGTALEVYYVLSGGLQYALNGSLHRIGPGQHIVVEHIDAPLTLQSLTTTNLLVTSSQPQFYQISHNFEELTQLAVEIEIKDGYTADHCRRLQRLSYATGQQLGLSQTELYRLDFGALLHDIGKVEIPVEILQKPGELTPEEWNRVKQHPSLGREILATTHVKEAGIVVEQHHERMDGSGYPYGLSGKDILTEAYIVAVADTFDAMTTDRPYRKALPDEVALEEIRKYAGVHYPKEVADAFFAAVEVLGEGARAA